MNSEPDNRILLRDIEKLRVASSFLETTKIKSTDFETNGELLAYSLVSDKDEVAVLRLSEKLEKPMMIKVDKYGAGIVKFIDREHLLTSSERQNDDIRLLSFSPSSSGGSSYIRYFHGHTKKVTSLSTSDGIFISGSHDCTVLLWDVRNERSLGRIEFDSPTLVAFEPYGDVFAVASGDCRIQIYEKMNLKTPLNTFEFAKVPGVEWRGLKFSTYSGKYLMVTTNSTSILIIDAATGELLQNFRGECD
jgi:WD40 repeat protein